MIDAVILTLVWIFPVAVVAAVVWKAIRARGTRS